MQRKLFVGIDTTSLASLRFFRLLDWSVCIKKSERSCIYVL